MACTNDVRFGVACTHRAVSMISHVTHGLFQAELKKTRSFHISRINSIFALMWTLATHDCGVNAAVVSVDCIVFSKLDCLKAESASCAL